MGERKTLYSYDEKVIFRWIKELSKQVMQTGIEERFTVKTLLNHKGLSEVILSLIL
jgi:hypothetical protein